MSARDEILGRLRDSLRQPGLPFPARDVGPVLRGQHLAVTGMAGDQAAMAARFGEELEKLSGSYEIAPSVAAARLMCISRLTDWVEEDDNNRKGMVLETGQEQHILCWQPDVLGLDSLGEALETLNLTPISPTEMQSEESRNNVRHIRYGLTGVSAACATTGTTIMMSSSPGTNRVASLLPYRHMVLIPYSRLYHSLETWIAEQRGSATLVDIMQQNANIALISGPSKSADIEGALTIGVHGPRHVHAIIFDDGA